MGESDSDSSLDKFDEDVYGSTPEEVSTPLPVLTLFPPGLGRSCNGASKKGSEADKDALPRKLATDHEKAGPVDAVLPPHAGPPRKASADPGKRSDKKSRRTDGGDSQPGIDWGDATIGHLFDVSQIENLEERVKAVDGALKRMLDARLANFSKRLRKMEFDTQEHLFAIGVLQATAKDVDTRVGNYERDVNRASGMCNSLWYFMKESQRLNSIYTPPARYGPGGNVLP